MAETLTCPNCGAHVPPGRFCERCGCALEPRTPASVESIRTEPMLSPQPPARAVPPQPPTKPAVPQRPAPVSSVCPDPTVAIDTLCVQNGSWGDGFLRVTFDPGAGGDGCDRVTLALQDQATGKRYALMEDAWCNRPHEFRVIVERHALGPVGYFVSLAYEKDNRRVRLEGDWATVSIADHQAGDAARQLVVNITNNITTGHACDVNNSSSTKDELERILRSGGDVSQELRNLVCGSARAYASLDLFDVNGIKALPLQPPQAKVDRLTLDFGAQRLLLFSSPTVTFGRRRELCDIFWRHPDADRLAADDPANNDYRKISRRQCLFEHRGDKVALIDGGRDERGRISPSSFGTYFNAVRVEGEKLLPSDGSVGTGLVTFSDSAATGTLSVCLPGAVCEKCTRADRRWCANGRRPSLVFKRLDGAPETAVMVWSCFRLEEVVPSFEGVKIFRENGGFAWRRGRYCGWLVPGETIETDFGPVRVLALQSPAEIAGEMKDVGSLSETRHN